jgi:hypothetical protein
MGFLCCTKKITDLLGVKPAPYISDSDTTILGPWYANLFLVERKKCLIFVNARTLLSFVVVNQTKRDIMQIDEMFRRHLFTRLRAESVNRETIKKIMEDYEMITLCKTADRGILGAMNDLVFRFRVHCEMEEGLAYIDMNKANKQAARTVMKLNNEYVWPQDMLRKIVSEP